MNLLNQAPEPKTPAQIIDQANSRPCTCDECGCTATIYADGYTVCKSCFDWKFTNFNYLTTETTEIW